MSFEDRFLNAFGQQPTLRACPHCGESIQLSAMGLEKEVKARWGSCEWRIWKDLPRYKKDGRFVN